MTLTFKVTLGVIWKVCSMAGMGTGNPRGRGLPVSTKQTPRQ